jgi:hypothetical protein
MLRRNRRRHNPGCHEAAADPFLPMSIAKPRRLYIQGLTPDGKAFRPSDWSERLAGAMSSFRPGGGVSGVAAHIGYSPYCVPRVIDGVKCVLVSEALKDIEPMAWDFVVNFAHDNGLRLIDATDDAPAPGSGA